MARRFKNVAKWHGWRLTVPDADMLPLREYVRVVADECLLELNRQVSFIAAVVFAAQLFWLTVGQ